MQGVPYVAHSKLWGCIIESSLNSTSNDYLKWMWVIIGVTSIDGGLLGSCIMNQRFNRAITFRESDKDPSMIRALCWIFLLRYYLVFRLLVMIILFISYKLKSKRADTSIMALMFNERLFVLCCFLYFWNFDHEIPHLLYMHLPTQMCLYCWPGKSQGSGCTHRTRRPFHISNVSSR